MTKLHDERIKLKENKKDYSDHELKQIEKEIADEACTQIQETIKGLNSETGGYNPGHLWKLKSKIIPKQTQVPTAMIDPKSGKLFTNENDLKKYTVDYYTDVLRNISFRYDTFCDLNFLLNMISG